MAYVAWSVVFGEQPSAAKWNILGTNDASFNDGTGFANDIIKSQHINWADTGGGDNGGIWWEELGRTTLGSANDTISVASFGARKYLQILFFALDTGGTIRPNLTFNSDSGSNYAITTSENGGADGSATSQSTVSVTGAASASPCSVEVLVNGNSAGDERICHFRGGFAGAAGAANAPGNRREGVFKWSNTANQITTVTFANVGTGDFAAGSEAIVLGHD